MATARISRRPGKVKRPYRASLFRPLIPIKLDRKRLMAMHAGYTPVRIYHPVRLTMAQVKMIVDDPQSSAQALAKVHGVSRQTICNIRRRSHATKKGQTGTSSRLAS
jgi:hypothetical protein